MKEVVLSNRPSLVIRNIPPTLRRAGRCGREVGREEGKRGPGYHRRSLAETAMMRLKTLFSDRLKGREWHRQETELRLRRAALNRMTCLGMPRSCAV